MGDIRMSLLSDVALVPAVWAALLGGWLLVSEAPTVIRPAPPRRRRLQGGIRFTGTVGWREPHVHHRPTPIVQ